MEELKVKLYYWLVNVQVWMGNRPRDKSRRCSGMFIIILKVIIKRERNC